MDLKVSASQKSAQNLHDPPCIDAQTARSEHMPRGNGFNQHHTARVFNGVLRMCSSETARKESAEKNR